MEFSNNEAALSGSLWANALLSRFGAANAGGEHVVRPGDTLGEIAAENGTTVEALAEANDITDPNMIMIGQRISIPASDGDEGAGDVDTPEAGGMPADIGTESVVSGETVSPSSPEVAAVVDAMPADIRAANPEASEHVARILTETKAQGLTPEQTAYVLASATYETNLGLFMSELPIDDRPAGSQYENRTDLGNTEPGDGARFKGRGYVQITGRDNYEDWSQRLGIDLVNDPELAADPDVAVKILVGGMKDGTFTTLGLEDFINESGTDYVGARAIVNGNDKDTLFAEAARFYEAALESVPASESTPDEPVFPSGFDALFS